MNSLKKYTNNSMYISILYIHMNRYLNKFKMNIINSTHMSIFSSYMTNIIIKENIIVNKTYKNIRLFGPYNKFYIKLYKKRMVDSYNKIFKERIN